MKRLLNKSCVITGGAGGIGFAAVQRFLAEGARVVIADLNEENGREKVAQIADQGLGDRVRFCRCDISNEAEVIRLIQFTVEQFGGIDSIFNNAGVGGAYGPITHTRVHDWDRTLEINLRGTFLCVKHAARAMIRQDRGGSIVNNASVVARVGDAAGAAYAAAKAGVLNLTATAAIQLAPHGIRVNSVSPGTIITPLLHRGKEADNLCRAAIEHQPWPEVDTGEHVASVAAFLASEDAGFITSEDLFADGGAGAAGPGYCSTTGAMRELLAPYLQDGGEQLLEY
jgi:NAD(P)-dependent dehydrogenase (short-subunit alcohol dehydrogenase family)